jgi:hypothetical protein
MEKQKELAHMLSVVNELNAQLTAQLADKEAEVVHWKANHDNMVKKNSMLSQRHDLPVDRIQAAKHFDDLNAEVERLRDEGKRLAAAGDLATIIRRASDHANGNDLVQHINDEARRLEQLLSTPQQETIKQERDDE